MLIAFFSNIGTRRPPCRTPRLPAGTSRTPRPPSPTPPRSSRSSFTHHAATTRVPRHPVVEGPGAPGVVQDHPGATAPEPSPAPRLPHRAEVPVLHGPAAARASNARGPASCRPRTPAMGRRLPPAAAGLARGPLGHRRPSRMEVVVMRNAPGSSKRRIEWKSPTTSIGEWTGSSPPPITGRLGRRPLSPRGVLTPPRSP